MSQEYDDDEFQQSGGGWWIRLLGVIVYILVIVAYAVQTLELVQWLFPDGNWFMQIITVFVCDGCATGYAMAEMFYRFRLRRSKQLTFGMWIVTFVLSTAATVIQMYLSSTHNIPHVIDPNIITLAYGLIIVAFVVNIISITVIIRMEYGASQPVYRYLDDRPKQKKQKAASQVQVQPVSTDAPQLTAPKKDTPEPAQKKLEPVKLSHSDGSPARDAEPLAGPSGLKRPLPASSASARRRQHRPFLQRDQPSNPSQAPSE